jgi:hypothetical protein
VNENEEGLMIDSWGSKRAAAAGDSLMTTTVQMKWLD